MFLKNREFRVRVVKQPELTEEQKETATELINVLNPDTIEKIGEEVKNVIMFGLGVFITGYSVKRILDVAAHLIVSAAGAVPK